MTRSVITFDNITSKPTTRAGYGITDAAPPNAAQYAVSYLVIGGGGQGGTSAYNDGAGGGAGGGDSTGGNGVAAGADIGTRSEPEPRSEPAE